MKMFNFTIKELLLLKSVIDSYRIMLVEKDNTSGFLSDYEMEVSLERLKTIGKVSDLLDKVNSMIIQKGR